MEALKMMVQSTPNPNALKFVLNRPVKKEGKATYKTAEECHENPLARNLFTVAHVSEVYFYDNVITVTQDGSGDWDTIEGQVKAKITESIDTHNPDFKAGSEHRTAKGPSSPEITKIDEILNRTVRPYLQADGGDLQVLAVEENIVTVHYQGACGTCPSSIMGTLKAIEGILRDEYRPDAEAHAVRIAHSDLLARLYSKVLHKDIPDFP